MSLGDIKQLTPDVRGDSQGFSFRSAACQPFRCRINQGYFAARIGNHDTNTQIRPHQV
jgi:hypothetical protein